MTLSCSTGPDAGWAGLVGVGWDVVPVSSTTGLLDWPCPACWGWIIARSDELSLLFLRGPSLLVLPLLSCC